MVTMDSKYLAEILGGGGCLTLNKANAVTLAFRYLSQGPYCTLGGVNITLFPHRFLSI